MADGGGGEILVPMRHNVRICTVCRNEFEVEPLIVRDGDLCPTCRRAYGGMAFIYCNTCRAVVSRVEPGMAASGFLVKPGDLLHVAKCPACDMSVTEIVPEEMKEYAKGT